MATETFTYSGNKQTWTSQSSQTVTIYMTGAGGGDGGATNDGSGGTGGSGGYLEMDYQVSDGETLEMYVGETGTAGESVEGGTGGSGGWGYENGGDGGHGDRGAGGGGGGGATVVRNGSGTVIGSAGAGGGGGGHERSGSWGGGGGGGARGGAAGKGYGSPTAGGGTGAGGAGGDGNATDNANAQYPGEDGGTVANTDLGSTVTATTGGGNTGHGSVEIVFLPAPTLSPPEATDSRQLALDWTIEDDNPDGDVRVRRRSADASEHEIAALSPDTTTYTDTGLLDGERYEYAIRRVTPDTSADSDWVSAVTWLPNPEDLTVESVDERYMNLSWTDPSNNTVGYQVYRSRDGGASYAIDGERIPNYFGTHSEAVGYWNSDVTIRGAVDGFEEVGHIEASGSFEDIFTDQFTTDDFPEYAGPDQWVSLRVWARWNEIPAWENTGEWVRKPAPDPDRYQEYVLRSDGQNADNEYFRLYYGNNTETAVADIADPVVWKGTGETEPTYRTTELLDGERYTLRAESYTDHASAVDTAVSEGLVDWWTFDGADTDEQAGIARDRGPAGNDGSIEGGVTTGVEGVAGGAYEFNGEDGCVRIPDAPTWDLSAFTLSLWLYQQSGVGNSTYIEHGDNNVNQTFQLWKDTGRFRLKIDDTNGNQHKPGTIDVPTERWCHIVAAFHSTDGIRFYVDGVLTHERQTGYTPRNSSAPVVIGDGRYYAEPHTGRLDDVRIYNRAITDAEARALYNWRY